MVNPSFALFLLRIFTLHIVRLKYVFFKLFTLIPHASSLLLSFLVLRSRYLTLCLHFCSILLLLIRLLLSCSLSLSLACTVDIQAYIFVCVCLCLCLCVCVCVCGGGASQCVCFPECLSTATARLSARPLAEMSS